ncbi:MAG: GTPase [Candidatus Micrarchaeia archaeon]
MKVLDRIRKECDVIIRVADARNPATLFPFPTRRHTLIVFNKVDLCDEREVNALRKKYRTAMFVSTRNREGKGKLFYELVRIAKQEGRPIRVGIIGYPNVGKSSLINLLKGRRTAKVSATPGETKGVQWIRLRPDILLYDTPGVVPIKKTQEELAKSFAVSASNVEDAEGTAEKMIMEMVRKKGLENVCAHYGIACERNMAPSRMLALIARRYNMLAPGGELDLDRAARKVIRDWQKGKI